MYVWLLKLFGWPVGQWFGWAELFIWNQLFCTLFGVAATLSLDHFHRILFVFKMRFYLHLTSYNVFTLSWCVVFLNLNARVYVDWYRRFDWKGYQGDYEGKSVIRRASADAAAKRKEWACAKIFTYSALCPSTQGQTKARVERIPGRADVSGLKFSLSLRFPALLAPHITFVIESIIGDSSDRLCQRIVYARSCFEVGLFVCLFACFFACLLVS